MRKRSHAVRQQEVSDKAYRSAYPLWFIAKADYTTSYSSRLLNITPRASRSRLTLKPYNFKFTKEWVTEDILQKFTEKTGVDK